MSLQPGQTIYILNSTYITNQLPDTIYNKKSFEIYTELVHKKYREDPEESCCWSSFNCSMYFRVYSHSAPLAMGRLASLFSVWSVFISCWWPHGSHKEPQLDWNQTSEANDRISL